MQSVRFFGVVQTSAKIEGGHFTDSLGGGTKRMFISTSSKCPRTAPNILRTSPLSHSSLSPSRLSLKVRLVKKGVTECRVLRRLQMFWYVMGDGLELELLGTKVFWIVFWEERTSRKGENPSERRAILRRYIHLCFRREEE